MLQSTSVLMEVTVEVTEEGNDCERSWGGGSASNTEFIHTNGG